MVTAVVYDYGMPWIRVCWQRTNVYAISAHLFDWGICLVFFVVLYANTTRLVTLYQVEHIWVSEHLKLEATQYRQHDRKGHGPGSLIHSLLYVRILRVHACNSRSNLGPLWGLAFTHVRLLFHWWSSCINFNLLSSTTALGMFSSLDVGWSGLTKLKYKLGPPLYLVLCGWDFFYVYHTLPIHNRMTIICIIIILDVCTSFSFLSHE